MLQEEVLPALGVGALHAGERIERELVVRAVRVGGVDDAVEKAHAGAPVKPKVRERNARRVAQASKPDAGRDRQLDVDSGFQRPSRHQASAISSSSTESAVKPVNMGVSFTPRVT